MKYFTQQIQKAISIAATHHDGQERKGDGLPYIIHPFAVALILMEYTDDQDVIVAGFLHDTVEDTEYSAEDIEKDFNPHIAEIVMDVTEKDKDDPWQKRKDDYLAHLKTSSFESKLVCAADKLHNLQSMLAGFEKFGEAVYEKFNAPADKKIWFYKECLNILKTEPKIPAELIKEIEELFTELEKNI